MLITHVGPAHFTVQKGRQIQAQSKERSPAPEAASYLIRVHLEFANDFDSHFALVLGVPGSIDVAEGAVSHFLHENISFEPWVFGQFALLLSLFIDDLLQLCLSRLILCFLSVTYLTGGLGSNIPRVHGADVILSRQCWRLLLIVGILATKVLLCNCLAMIPLLLVVCMNRRDIGGGLVAWWLGCSGLLAVADEVFEVLNSTHRSDCGALYADASTPRSRECEREGGTGRK